ncbi:hypothetical protein [Mangrovicella endophytica]|uniref:hypothetical protein n=1 Tax=Mangrovicella endophytica TaxID=2066697 RepID=UPI000C9E77E9|nr:hypothetical protein [Mangrovicella endophytica]
MTKRLVAALAVTVALASCTSSFKRPTLPRVDFSKLQPRIDLSKLRLPRSRKPEPLRPVAPRPLTPMERRGVEAGVRAAYEEPDTVRFHRFKSGITDKGTLAVCGLVNTELPDGSSTNLRLFRGEGQLRMDGGVDFVVGEIAGANSDSLDVFAACRDLGLV